MRLQAVIPLLLGLAIPAFCAPEIKRIEATWCENGVELSISGSDLAEAREVWTTMGAKFAIVAATENLIRARASGSVVPNVYAGRVFGSNGVSAVQPFILDEVATVQSSETNRTRQSAQPITPPCAVAGVARELGYCWFRFNANRGKRVAVETVAARLGSRLDSVVRVIDARGREVAFSDDAPGMRADSHASFIAAEAGDYFIELRDVNYSGGDEFTYHLRIGEFPLVTTTHPVAVQWGSKTKFNLAGGDCNAARVTATANEGTSFVALAHGRAFAKALVTNMREAMEHEQATIDVPCAVNGRFEEANDRDIYEFRVSKGQKLAFRGQTRSVGSACDLVMELQSTNGQRLARSNVSAADEGIIAHTVNESGVIRLIVTEATGAHGPALVYRVTAEPSAGFTLAVEIEAVQAKAGADFELKVAAARDDYKGEIVLALEGADGLSASNNAIRAGQTNATLKVQVPDTLEAGIARHFAVVGRAAKEQNGPSVRATTASALRKRWPQLLHVPFELEGQIALGVHP